MPVFTNLANTLLEFFPSGLEGETTLMGIRWENLNYYDEVGRDVRWQKFALLFKDHWLRLQT